MGTVSISGKTFDIFGELSSDAGTSISATTYFLGQLNTTAWDAASFEDRQKSLVTATRILDKQKWTGTMTDPDTPQPLSWPRAGVTDCDGNAVLDSVTPEGIIFGTYELASAILEDATVQSAKNAGSNVRRTRSKKKADVLELESETEYFTSTNIPGTMTSAGRFPPAVMEYVSCFFGSTGIATVTITGAQESFFGDRDYGYDGEGLP